MSTFTPKKILVFAIAGIVALYQMNRFTSTWENRVAASGESSSNQQYLGSRIFTSAVTTIQKHLSTLRVEGYTMIDGRAVVTANHRSPSRGVMLHVIKTVSARAPFESSSAMNASTGQDNLSAHTDHDTMPAAAAEVYVPIVLASLEEIDMPASAREKQAFMQAQAHRKSHKSAGGMFQRMTGAMSGFSSRNVEGPPLSRPEKSAKLTLFPTALKSFTLATPPLVHDESSSAPTNNGGSTFSAWRREWQQVCQWVSEKSEKRGPLHKTQEAAQRSKGRPDLQWIDYLDDVIGRVVHELASFSLIEVTADCPNTTQKPKQQRRTGLPYTQKTKPTAASVPPQTQTEDSTTDGATSSNEILISEEL